MGLGTEMGLCALVLDHHPEPSPALSSRSSEPLMVLGILPGLPFPEHCCRVASCDWGLGKRSGLGSPVWGELVGHESCVLLPTGSPCVTGSEGVVPSCPAPSWPALYPQLAATLCAGRAADKQP